MNKGMNENRMKEWNNVMMKGETKEERDGQTNGKGIGIKWIIVDK